MLLAGLSIQSIGSTPAGTRTPRDCVLLADTVCDVFAEASLAEPESFVSQALARLPEGHETRTPYLPLKQAAPDYG